MWDSWWLGSRLGHHPTHSEEHFILYTGHFHILFFFLAYFTFCLLFWLFWHVVKDLNLYNYRRGRFKSKWLSLFVIEVIKTSQLYIEHIRQRKFFYFHNFSSWNLCQNLLSKDPQFPNTKWQKLKFPAQVFRLDLAARGSFFLLIC